MLRCTWAGFVIAGIAWGQYAAVVQEKEPGPDRSPRADAEPRRRLSVDPDSLLPLLLSRDVKERSIAFHSAGLDSIAERDPKDVRLFAVNIDEDADIERVLIVKAIQDTAAVVLKKKDGAWWELGSFLCCGPGSQLVDPFIELRQTVWFGTNDVVVHAGGSFGSGVGEQRLLIYRVWRGRLYKVLDIVKWAYNLSESEETRVLYPSLDSATAQRVLTIHRTKAGRNRRRTTRERYRWDAGRFVFVAVER